MKTAVDLIQGTDAWKAHRAEHFNASDCPAMMGVSKYKTRSQLVKEFATGIIAEFDEATERRFADGHRFEALARPLAEKIIGDDLSPVTGTDGKYSASFDGITFDESVIFEHKTLNARIKECATSETLEEQYHAQMEHQLMVSGADKCLFMASKFDADDNLLEEVHFWYYSKPGLRTAIVSGWEQFAIDVTNYQYVEWAQEVIAAPTKDLPALSIQVNGSISLISNLNKFGAELNAFVAQIDKEPSDDQGFADAELAIKMLQNAQDALEAAEANALAQTSDIDDMRKTVKLYADIARTTRLMLEKMVKARKESIRVEIVQAAKQAFTDHCRELEAETKPIGLYYGIPDFAGAIKNKRTITSLRDAVDTLLANSKIHANALATDIRAKLAWCKETSAGFGFLFADLQGIITDNGMEAFQAIVTRRIDDHKATEAAKLEAQRIAMQAEEERKALAKVAAEEQQRIAAQVKAQLEAQAALLAVERATKAEDAEMQLGRAVYEPKFDPEAEERRLRTVLGGVLAPLPIMQVEMVTIPKTEYSELCADSKILNCLRNAGVDNWEWYDDAIAEYYKE